MGSPNGILPDLDSNKVEGSCCPEIHLIYSETVHSCIVFVCFSSNYTIVSQYVGSVCLLAISLAFIETFSLLI